VFFQTAEAGFLFQVAGTVNLPVDGQFHDITVPLAGVIDRDVISTFGVNLAPHPNNVFIDVDLVRFANVPVLEGDYNNDGAVNAGDYVVWRKANNTSLPLPNDLSPGVTDADYDVWAENFGEPNGAGGAGGVPEPTALVLWMTATVCGLFAARRRS
jgi:hypothetical protein